MLNLAPPPSTSSGDTIISNNVSGFDFSLVELIQAALPIETSGITLNIDLSTVEVFSWGVEVYS